MRSDVSDEVGSPDCGHQRPRDAARGGGIQRGGRVAAQKVAWPGDLADDPPGDVRAAQSRQVIEGCRKRRETYAIRDGQPYALTAVGPHPC